MSTPLTCTKVFTITVGTPTLLAYYKLDEASPVTSLHDEVASRDLTVTLGYGIGVVGKISGGLQLGVSSLEWDAATDAEWTMAGDFTVRFWLKPVYSILGAGHYIVYSHGIPDQWSINLNADVWSPGDMAIHFTVDCVGSMADIYSPALTLGAWNHCVLWFEQGVGVGCRIDAGVTSTAADADPISPPALGNPQLIVGCSHFWGANVLDEIGIWKRKLTSAEIVSDYNTGTGKTYPNVPL